MGGSRQKGGEMGNSKNVNIFSGLAVFIVMAIFVMLNGLALAQNQEEPAPVPTSDEQIQKLVQQKLAEQREDFDEKIKQLEQQISEQKQALEVLDQQLPNRIATGARKVNREAAQREEEQRERFLERNQDLIGRAWAWPYGADGASGVKIDFSASDTNSTGEGKSSNAIQYAKITPFIRVGGQIPFGFEMVLDAKTMAARGANLKKLIVEEVLTDGELREQVSKLNFEKIELYVRVIDTDKLEWIIRTGQLDNEFVRAVKEVADAAVYINKTIMDKYSLNTAMAMRMDVGFGRLEAHDPLIKERVLWIQASTFGVKKYKDFAVRVLLSLAILNRFTDNFNFKAIDVWGGFARVGSGAGLAGEKDSVNDPSKSQELAVFGFKIDLAKLTGKDLGAVYAEFVHRRKTGDITDQSFVMGWDTKIPPTEEGKRPMEIGVRFQSQQDDPDPTVADGTALTAGVLYPLRDYNLALVINVSYVLDSTDPERDGEVLVTTDFQLLY